MSRKWWRSEAHVATSPATSALLMKNGLWFAGCVVRFRLLGYQHGGRVSACLKFVSATVSLSACSQIGNTAFLQTVFPSWKLWSPMLSHYREKTLSTFSIVAPVQEKNIFIAGCSFCPQFVSLFRYRVSHCRGQMHSSIVWQSHLLYWELWQSSDWSIQKIFHCYQLIWVMCANFSMRLLQRKRSVGISIHNALFGLLTWGNYSLLAMPSLLPANVFPCLVTNVYQWLVHVHPNHSIAYKLSRG